MQTLNVSIERMGTQIPVGCIIGNSSDDAQFHYEESYMKEGLPISISLPFTEKSFSPEKTRSYFEGLLPEGFTRRSVAQWIHADENDYLSILKALGNECLGALRVTDTLNKPSSGYEKLSLEQVRALAAEGATISTELIVKTHLSLAGASGKVGLYFDENHKEWYLPIGSSPSTHIVKQSHVRLKNVVTNEQLCLLTAYRLGIEVPQSFIINTGKGTDGEILFATRRFDRIKTEGAAEPLPVPMRLHQEDFAQAGGIPSKDKYESEGSAYLKYMMDTLRNYSADPIEDQKKLWKIICFNWLVGNTDAHIKNFSLLYSPDMRKIRLAPAYDIMSTVIYPESTRNMSFRIGSSTLIDEINRDAFISAAQESITGKKMVLSILDQLCDGFESALSESASELKDQGFDKAALIQEQILKCGGFYTL